MALQHLTYLTPLILVVHTPYEMGTAFIPNLHIVKLQPRGAESLAQDHKLVGGRVHALKSPLCFVCLS